MIIYAADVAKGSTKPMLNMGDVRMIPTEAFLSEMDAEKILEHTEEKLSEGIIFTDEDCSQKRTAERS